MDGPLLKKKKKKKKTKTKTRVKMVRRRWSNISKTLQYRRLLMSNILG
jgi:hypothetical protein